MTNQSPVPTFRQWLAAQPIRSRHGQFAADVAQVPDFPSSPEAARAFIKAMAPEVLPALNKAITAYRAALKRGAP